LKRGRLVIAMGLALCLPACAYQWGGKRPPRTFDSPAAELSSLRSEREDLRGRLRASRLREDTQRARNSAFPTNGAMDTWQMEGRLSDIDHRIRDLEAAEAEGANTSTKKIRP
jgi:hypothetical protein